MRGAASSVGLAFSEPSGKRLFRPWKLCRARPICFRLLRQEMRLAASRTFCTAGTSRAINTPMIAITTRSSISVKALRADDMAGPRDEKCADDDALGRLGKAEPPRGISTNADE